jgi:hypothetical protein
MTVFLLILSIFLLNFITKIELIDRPEYWVVYKNIFNNLKHPNNRQNITLALADELCFRLDERNGNLNFYINGNLITECLFNVDITQKLWFFFDLCGKTNAIRLIPSCQSIVNASLNAHSNVTMRSALNSVVNNNNNNNLSEPRRKRPSSALINYYKTQIKASSMSQNGYDDDENDKTVVLNGTVQSSLNADKNGRSESKSKLTPDNPQTVKKSVSKYEGQEECKICWNAPIECVLYSCGHMCLCWNW